MPISFEEYCEDVLNSHIGLMSSADIEEAKKSFRLFISPEKSPREVAAEKKALEKAKSSRALAKFYGGKALTGTPRQKEWAEEIRNNFLADCALSAEEKAELVTCGGFTNTAKFWIENKTVPASKMKARNIVAQYRGLNELKAKHADTLARTGLAIEKERAQKEIQDYINSCDFKWPA